MGLRYIPRIAYNNIVSKAKPQTLYIKNPKAHKLAERLSRKMGVNLTDAVIHSLEQQLRAPSPLIDMAKVDAICRRIASQRIEDPRTNDEILGYDEIGLPR